MKVLHVTPSYYPAFVYGGPIRSTHQMNLALAEQGLTVRVLTTDANGDVELPESGTTVQYGAGLSAEYCPRTFMPDISLALLWRLPAAVRWADVVHLTAVYSFTTLPTLFWCRILGRPMFWSPRGALQEWHGSPRRGLKAAWDSLARLLGGRAVTIVAASEREAEAARDRFPRMRVVLVENGVVVPESPNARKPEDATVLFLGRVHPIKGIENLIDAVARSNARLIVAGPANEKYLDALRRKAEEAGAAERVSFIGAVDEVRKEEWFARSSLLALPSFSENFGIVVAEALAHGLPVVASRNTPWSGLEDRKCGRWVENDPESLAAAIAEVLNSDPAAMGARGRAWMLEAFTWSEKARRLCEYYRGSTQRT